MSDVTSNPSSQDTNSATEGAAEPVETALSREDEEKLLKSLRELGYVE